MGAVNNWVGMVDTRHYPGNLHFHRDNRHIIEAIDSLE
jgi:hypothetical protein